MAELPKEKMDPFKEIMTATSDSKQARQLGHGNGESGADLEAHKNAVADQPDEDAEAEQPCEQAKPGHRESRKACDLHIALRIAFGHLNHAGGDHQRDRRCGSDGELA